METMRKIKNPFTNQQNNECFGCSPENQFGLQMEFFEDGEEIVCYWKPQDFFQGYEHVLHGGIQATLADEIASWVVFTKLQTAGVTTKLEIKYKKPLFTNRGTILLRAKLQTVRKRIAEIQVNLWDEKGVLCAEANVHYFLLPIEKAKEKFGFTEPASFMNVESKKF